MKTRKTYADEFKKQAVELAESMNNYTGAAKQLGISDSLIHSWKRINFNSPDAEKKAKVYSDPETELKKLRKENAELKKVNYILKSAAAFFSQDHLK
jgi:transposase